MIAVPVNSQSTQPAKATSDATIPRWYVMRDLLPRNASNSAYKVLGNMGIKVFTPMHWEIVNSGNNRKTRRYLPIINDLLFIYDTREVIDSLVASVKKLQYRYQCGGKPHTPIVIGNEEMQSFINAVNNDPTPIYFTPEELTPAMIGREAEVNGGPMNGCRGRLLKMQGSRKRRIIMEIPGLLAAAVEVNPDYLKLL